MYRAELDVVPVRMQQPGAPLAAATASSLCVTTSLCREVEHMPLICCWSTKKEFRAYQD